MKYFIIVSIVFSLISCESKKQTKIDKVPTQSEIKQEYMDKALRTDEYKEKWIAVQKIKLDIKNLTIANRDNAINEYNDLIGNTFGFIDNIDSLKARMKNSGKEYLKTVQLQIAADLLLQHMADLNAESNGVSDSIK